jgi:hypothetical protein
MEEFKSWYYKNKSDYPGFEPSFGKKGSNDVLREIRSMGVKTIADFKKIMPPNLKQAYRKVSKPDDRLTYSLIVRGILIMSNPAKYFNKVWKKDYFDTLDNMRTEFSRN